MENHADGNNTQKVLEEFTIDPNPSQAIAFNCTPFDELQDRGVLPDDYSCTNATTSVASPIAVQKLWYYGVAFGAIAFGCI